MRKNQPLIARKPSEGRRCDVNDASKPVTAFRRRILKAWRQVRESFPVYQNDPNR